MYHIDWRSTYFWQWHFMVHFRKVTVSTMQHLENFHLVCPLQVDLNYYFNHPFMYCSVPKIYPRSLSRFNISMIIGSIFMKHFSSVRYMLSLRIWLKADHCLLVNFFLILELLFEWTKYEFSFSTIYLYVRDIRQKMIKIKSQAYLIQ